MKIEDTECSVCLNCGSISFNHTKIDVFIEKLNIKDNVAWVEREYEAYSMIDQGVINCAECDSENIGEIDLAKLSFMDIKLFFRLEDEKRLLFLKKHNISIE